jgi:serine/threonine-protein kinase
MIGAIGPYRVVEKLGEGGMGEVYHAHDAKLNRGVAIKILLSAVANDPDRLARFSREAQVLASLNHPNIAHIHGLEQGEAGPFLVMELVDGPTLADRIARGPIPVDESLAIARQIAEALEAAHERGIIHRDLKPANIKVRDDGMVKVLDFGLAKAIDGSSGAPGAAAANSPTITTPAMMTGAGIILGTAAYMSPEQAKGRVVDRRTDVWAFACILYEMLTGRRAFDGEDVTDTIAAVVRGEPDWKALPVDVSPQIRLLMKRCVEKDRRARVADISVARFLMNETIESSGPGAGASPAAPPAPARRRLLGTAGIGILVGAALAAAAAWIIVIRTPHVQESSVRFAIVPPPSLPLAIQGSDHDVAITPDGSHIIYRAGPGPLAQAQLAVRAIDELEARPLAGTGGARNPFVSPDGRWVAFFSGTELRKVSITGGPAVTLCRLNGAPRGGSWGDDDTIVFAANQRGLQRVSAGGGQPTTLTSPDTAKGEGHLFPSILPGSHAVLFTVNMGTLDTARVDILELKSGRQKTLIRGGHDAFYAHSGHLIYAVAPPGTGGRGTTSLRAVRFDAKRLEVTSDPLPVLDQVVLLSAGAADVALSRQGGLVYVSGALLTPLGTEQRSLVWVDRKGHEEPIPAAERAYAVARISPDGARVALDVRDQTNDIWVWDLKRHTLTPLNRDPAQDMSPVWTPDGSRLLWTSTRASSTTPNLFWQASDGTGPVERLTTNATNQFPTSIAPDGSHVVVFGGSTTGAAGSGIDLFTVRLQGGDHKAEPLIQSPAFEFDGEISPDGRWLAYHSNESGEFQVFVRPYPKVDSGRIQISTRGGTRAAWARNGRELFYLDESGLLTSVSVQTNGATFTAGAPTRILNTRYYAGSTILGLDLRAYDVAPDGQRFLMIKETAAPNQKSTETQASLIVVLNWLEELKQRLPAR